MAYGAFDKTVCTAPLGPIGIRSNFSNLNSTTRLVTTAMMMGNLFTGLVRMLSAYT